MDCNYKQKRVRSFCLSAIQIPSPNDRLTLIRYYLLQIYVTLSNSHTSTKKDLLFSFLLMKKFFRYTGLWLGCWAPTKTLFTVFQFDITWIQATLRTDQSKAIWRLKIIHVAVILNRKMPWIYAWMDLLVSTLQLCSFWTNVVTCRRVNVK